MNCFGRKIKKKLRKVWYSNFFSCFCADHESEISNRSMVMENEPNINEHLQLLMIRSLQRQAEDEEFHMQMRNTLIYLTTMLERLFKASSSQTQSDSSTSIENVSTFTITVSKSNFIQPQADVRSNSLVVLNPDKCDETFIPSRNSFTSNGSTCSLPSDILQHGVFGSKILCRNISSDKATQSHLSSHSLTASKLIQTHFISLSFFDIKGFKINLIRHIRTLKQDVVTLRELLSCVEYYQNRSYLDMRAIGVSKADFCREEEFEFKFIQAKARAINFVKFYKLRKLNDTKKSNRKKIKRII